MKIAIHTIVMITEMIITVRVDDTTPDPPAANAAGIARHGTHTIY